MQRAQYVHTDHYLNNIHGLNKTILAIWKQAHINEMSDLINKIFSQHILDKFKKLHNIQNLSYIFMTYSFNLPLIVKNSA